MEDRDVQLPLFALDNVGDFYCPVDPMDALQCDSCQ